MLYFWIDDSVEQDMRVMGMLSGLQLRCHNMPERTGNGFSSAGKIWKLLKSVYVVIPYAERIRFPDTRNRRNVDMFLDLIHARAAMVQYQRTTIEQAGYPPCCCNGG